MRAHGVNVAMALKTSALWSLVSGEAADRDAAMHGARRARSLSRAAQRHVQRRRASRRAGSVAGHGALRGRRGAVLARSRVVAVSGDVALADRIERIAYNAMPATMSADMWSHQYDQQANQVMCSLNRRRWVSNGPGVEPLRPRAQLRLLHGESAPGMAEARRAACGWRRPTTAWRRSSTRRAPSRARRARPGR